MHPYLLIAIAVSLIIGLYWLNNLFKKAKPGEGLEKEKKELQNEATQIMSVLPDIVSGFDAAGNITFLNKTHDGRDPKLLVGKNIKDLIGASEFHERMAIISEVIKSQKEITAFRKLEKKVFYTRAFPFKLSGSNTEVITIYTDITEQYRRDQIVKWASEAAKIGGWEIDLEQKTIHWSSQIYKIREVEKSADPSLDEAFEFYTPEFRPIIKAAVNNGISKGTPWDLELALVTAKGNLKWVRDVGIPEMENGKCKTLHGFLQDITERKNSELALRRREQELELAIEGGELGTWDWYIKTGQISFNDRWATMLGYAPHEIEPHVRSWEKLVHPDDMAYVTDLLQAHLKGETDYYESEHRVLHKQGHWVWVLDKGKILERDADGEPTRVSCIRLDITQRKTTELQNLRLQEELEEFKTAVDQSSIVAVADLKGIITYANHKFEEISQYTRAELIGRNHNIVNSGYHPKSFWKEMWQTIARGKIWRAEVKNKRKDGTYYWVDTFIMPLRDSENRITEYLSIRNDITDKKENEEKLQRALEKAEESDKLKSAFLANISHEIRTPMNAIMGLAELLERPNLAAEKRTEFSHLIYSRGRDLLTIVNDILEISKIEFGQIFSVPVVGHINELLVQLERSIQAEAFYLNNKELTILVVNQLEPAQNLIRTDFLKLNQVLTNLLSNAAKFTVKGSVELGCKLQGVDSLLFWVRDTGIGIPEDQLKIIFEPFRQGSDSIHQKYGGTGLGLAISKGLVEILGGKIWVESKPGIGSVFYFTVPYTPASGNPNI